MPLGGVAGGRERYHVAFIIQSHGGEIAVHRLHDLPIAVVGNLAQSLHERMEIGAGIARGESHAHAVGDAGLAGRVNHPHGEFRDVHAGFNAGGSAETKARGCVQELIHSIQHVEIHQARRFEPFRAASGRDTGRRPPPRVEGIEAVAVKIDARLGGRGDRRTSAQSLRRLLYGSGALVRVRGIQRQIVQTWIHGSHHGLARVSRTRWAACSRNWLKGGRPTRVERWGSVRSPIQLRQMRRAICS